MSLDHDHRWVMCRRPRVTVAGELTLEMLDLQLNPAAGSSTGPAQMKAGASPAYSSWTTSDASA